MHNLARFCCSFLRELPDVFYISTCFIHPHTKYRRKSAAAVPGVLSRRAALGRALPSAGLSAVGGCPAPGRRRRPCCAPVDVQSGSVSSDGPSADDLIRSRQRRTETRPSAGGTALRRFHLSAAEGGGGSFPYPCRSLTGDGRGRGRGDFSLPVTQHSLSRCRVGAGLAGPPPAARGWPASLAYTAAWSR